MSARNSYLKELAALLEFFISIKSQLSEGELGLIASVASNGKLPDLASLRGIRSKYDNAYAHMLSKIRQANLMEDEIKNLQLKLALYDQWQLDKELAIATPANSNKELATDASSNQKNYNQKNLARVPVNQYWQYIRK